MTVFSHIVSKRLNRCDRKFLTTKRRQKRQWIQANIFWGLEKRKTFPQQHLWCSTVHDKKRLQSGILHMQSVQKEFEANNLDKFFETQWPLTKVCELYHEIHIIWSSFHKIKNLLFINVHGSVHHINILLHIIPTRYTIHRVYFYLTLLYMFRALLSPIIRSTPSITHSNQFRFFHDSSRQQYGYIHYSIFYRTYCIFSRMYVIKLL
jgi:hypothetical protein